jgi:hypothetical protein
MKNATTTSLSFAKINTIIEIMQIWLILLLSKAKTTMIMKLSLNLHLVKGKRSYYVRYTSKLNESKE